MVRDPLEYGPIYETGDVHLEPTEAQKRLFRDMGFCGIEWHDRHGQWFVCTYRAKHDCTEHGYTTANMTPYRMVAER